MNIISDRLTITGLCEKLGVTPSWIGSVIRELAIPVAGRGRLREYTEAEFNIFLNVKRMRLCNIDWDDINKIRELDRTIRRKVSEYLDDLKRKNKKGDITLVFYGDSKPVLNFVLEEPLEIDIKAFKEKDNSHEQNVSAAIQIMINKQGARSNVEGIRKKLDVLKREIESFQDIIYYSATL